MKEQNYLFHGWIRNIEKTLKLTNIPANINTICILYFHGDGIFNVINKDMKLQKIRRKLQNRIMIGIGKIVALV